eukprot:TRINITY_DN1312_c1_g1_i1.p1 TRINITY_DN1312_c1_g1~~TRINITY_DN1312_c1_g1_i1.p1  ORF type:complete len:235 (+),score=49.56 TRINITY_DN1312_c1_g1_i1:103-807(+)
MAQKQPDKPLPSCILISAHGDTNWRQHRLQRQMGLREGETEEEVEYYGHMDNFGGVYAVMKAYFSGKLPLKGVRIEVTYGEETDMEGAKEVAKTINVSDIVIVVDVTGTKTTKNLVIEKCRNKRLRKFVKRVLEEAGIQADLYSNCPDPIATQDETNVYGKITDFTFFLGLPTRGGDYNEGPVRCFKKDLNALSKALVVLTHELQNFTTEKVPVGIEWEDVYENFSFFEKFGNL